MLPTTAASLSSGVTGLRKAALVFFGSALVVDFLVVAIRQRIKNESRAETIFISEGKPYFRAEFLPRASPRKGVRVAWAGRFWLRFREGDPAGTFRFAFVFSHSHVAAPFSPPFVSTLRPASRCLLVACIAVGHRSARNPAPAVHAEIDLPMSTVFKGRSTFDRLVARAGARKLARLAHRRTHRARGSRAGGHALPGLHPGDRRPRRIALGRFQRPGLLDVLRDFAGFARMLHAKPPPYAPRICCISSRWTATGTANAPASTSRASISWRSLFYDNEKRGLLTNITRRLPGAERMDHRDIREMTVMWRHYRYLRNNPGLLPRDGAHPGIRFRPAGLPRPEIRAWPRTNQYLQDGRHHRHHQPRHGRLYLARRPGVPRRGRHAAFPARVVETTPSTGGRPAFPLSGRQARRRGHRGGASGTTCLRATLAAN